jgi:hypothetical protein
MPAYRLEYCGDELPGNWVDISDAWTRGEVRAFYEAALVVDEKATAVILRVKLIGVHIYTANGDLLSDADALLARMDDLDVRLARWLSSGIMAALQELMSLGEARRRLSFAGSEIAMRPPKLPTTM